MQGPSQRNWAGRGDSIALPARIRSEAFKHFVFFGPFILNLSGNDHHFLECVRLSKNILPFQIPSVLLASSDASALHHESQTCTIICRLNKKSKSKS